MEDKNELNDIILNKGNATSSNKKIILAVATLGVILVVVVMLMNSLSSSGTSNLPQAALPPKPELTNVVKPADEPLFEDVKVIEEKTSDDSNLAQIAQKLKQESIKEEKISVVPEVIKPVAKKVVKAPRKIAPKVVASGSYYIQVGSFSKYKPNKKFLQSITNLNFNYKYHKVNNLNKVLVGPFKSRKEAKDARRVIRAKVEPGAFLVKL